MAVAVSISSCHVSENSNSGPVMPTRVTTTPQFKSVGVAALAGRPLRGSVEHGANTIGHGRFLHDVIRPH